MVALMINGHTRDLPSYKVKLLLYITIADG